MMLWESIETYQAQQDLNLLRVMELSQAAGTPENEKIRREFCDERIARLKID